MDNLFLFVALMEFKKVFPTEHPHQHLSDNNDMVPAFAVDCDFSITAQRNKIVAQVIIDLDDDRDLALRQLPGHVDHGPVGG